MPNKLFEYYYFYELIQLIDYFTYSYYKHFIKITITIKLKTINN